MVYSYHVFTNNNDEWFEESEKKEAYKLYKQWCKDFGTARMYLEETKLDENGENEELVSETCLHSFGTFPL